MSENRRYLSFSEFEVFVKKIESSRASDATRQTLVEDWGPTIFDLWMRACAIKDLSLSVEKWWILMWTPRVRRLFEQICTRVSPDSVWLHVTKKKIQNSLRNIAVHAVLPKGIFSCCVISYIQVFCFVKHYSFWNGKAFDLKCPWFLVADWLGKSPFGLCSCYSRKPWRQ